MSVFEAMMLLSSSAAVEEYPMMYIPASHVSTNGTKKFSRPNDSIVRLLFLSPLKSISSPARNII